MTTKTILIAAGVSLLCVGVYAVIFNKREYPEPNEPGGSVPDYNPPGMPPKQKNFSLSEFACHDGTPVPKSLYGNVQILMDNLQVLRDAIGLPIIVNSGYRTVDYNEKIGGVPDSMHLKAMAADIHVPGMTNNSVRAKISDLIASGKMLQGGMGSYASFTHYDVRGYKARWNG